MSSAAARRRAKKERDEAFPTKQLAVLAFCRVAEPVAFTSILAYSYEMVIHLQGGDEHNASFYSGLLVSAFAVAEASTAMVWGTISDRYGRKPIVLVGLAGTALSSLLFGFAQKYWVALLARLVGGLLNGNVAVMQTMVAEMVKKPEHEPRAYAVQPFMWSLGSIVGAAMGGFLADPAKYYPNTFSQDGIFGRFPYLLPNLVAVVAIACAILQGAILLKETNPLLLPEDEDDEDEATVDEYTPLQRHTSRLSSRISAVERSHTDGGRRPSFIAQSMPTASDQSFDLRRGSIGTIHSIRIIPTREHIQEQPRLSVTGEPEEPIKAFNKSVIMLTVALIIMCYHQMAFGSILPIYLLDKTDKPDGFDLYGGLSYTVHDVGVYMAVQGVICLFIQGLIFPVFVEKVGVWRSFVILTIFYPISYLIMPFISLLPRPFVPAGIYVTLFIQAFFSIIVYPCALILLKNAVPSSLVLGKVNGLAMSACSGARTIAPPLEGIIYSTAGSAAAWWSCAGFAFVAIAQLYFIPREEVDTVIVESAFKRKTSEETSANHVEES